MSAERRELKIPPEQWELPVSMDAEGHLLSLENVCMGKAVTLGQLTLDQQAEIVVARIRQQANFELSMVGTGIVSQEKAMEEVRAQTTAGKVLIEIEQRMIARMMDRAKGAM